MASRGVANLNPVHRIRSRAWQRQRRRAYSSSALAEERRARRRSRRIALTNGGASYVRVANPPLSGDLEAVTASPTSVSMAVASGGTSLYASFDDGRTWITTLGFGDGGLGLSELGFTTATQGVAIHGQIAYPQSLQLLMTRDGGHVWNPVAVAPG